MEDLTSETILGSFVPYRLHMRLAGDLGEYLPAQGEPQADAQATIVHEHMHYYQTIFTGYGQIAWQTQRQATAFLMNEWQDIPPTPDGRRRLPLANLACAGGGYLSRAIWINRSIHELLLLARARHSLTRPGARLHELGSMLVRHPWLVNPSVTLDGKSYIIEGRDIVETHAQFVEGTYSWVANNIPLAKTFDPKVLPKRYWAPLFFYFEQLGTTRIFEFPYICDLALQISWNPLIPQTEDQWRASSPSWRFVRLIEALREKPEIRLEAPERVRDQYTDFATALLKACGYSALDTILSERLDTFTRQPTLSHLETAMMAALKFRQSHPWCGGNPIEDANTWKEIVDKFPAPLLQVGHQIFSDGSRQSLDSEIIMELQFQAFADQIRGARTYAANAGVLECAYSLFDIDEGCEYQLSHACQGRIAPSEGLPFPVGTDPNGNLTGCQMGMLLQAMDLEPALLDINHEQRMPTEAEIFIGKDDKE